MFLKDSFLIAYYTRFYYMIKIILLGYMGSGKSTVGALLAELLHLKHFDLDQIIEKKQGLTVAEIFKLKGELYFRKIEHVCFKELIESDERFVLSLGGGTPCYANNHIFFMAENVYSFYLKASIETLFQRLRNSDLTRPLLIEKDKDELKDFIAKHLFDRIYYYYQAQNVVNIDNKSKIEIANEIFKIIDLKMHN